MKAGYIEWVSSNRISFITNIFGRVLYINRKFPNGEYESCNMPSMSRTLKRNCKRVRGLTIEDLFLEIL
jgi:hypothetical protein